MLSAGTYSDSFSLNYKLRDMHACHARCIHANIRAHIGKFNGRRQTRTLDRTTGVRGLWRDTENWRRRALGSSERRVGRR